MCDLSIIIPTFNRAHLLEQCLGSLWHGVRCSHEIIVVDGTSNDRTPQVIVEAQADMGDRIRYIREEQREGFVKAVNKGFREARGKYVMWINDDARPLAGALDTAVEQLDHASDDVAMVALFHRFRGARNVAYETVRDNKVYRLLHVRGTFYANFGIVRAVTLKQLGYFDERYFVNGADPDFSLKVWQAGMKVIPAYSALIDHDEHQDDRRALDIERGRDDNDRFFEKWNLPPKNLKRNEFDPANPCTLIGLRGTAQAA